MVYVIIGGHHRRNKDNRGTIIPVSKLVSHVGYDQRRHPDIAVVKLAEPVKFSTTIAPACLPVQGDVVTPVLNCYISGTCNLAVITITTTTATATTTTTMTITITLIIMIIMIMMMMMIIIIIIIIIIMIIKITVLITGQKGLSHYILFFPNATRVGYD